MTHAAWLRILVIDPDAERRSGLVAELEAALREPGPAFPPSTTDIDAVRTIHERDRVKQDRYDLVVVHVVPGMDLEAITDAAWHVLAIVDPGDAGIAAAREAARRGIECIDEHQATGSALARHAWMAVQRTAYQDGVPQEA